MGFFKQASQEHNIIINNPVSCALKMSRRAWKNQKSYKLVDIAKIGGFSTSSNHRALKDCELTIPVYTASSSILKSVD
jgi:DNA polymerase-3 subunit epsilon/DNA polymerase-3 subunit alpha (Gram-positive type)